MGSGYSVASRVEGFSTIAERRRRVSRTKSAIQLLGVNLEECAPGLRRGFAGAHHVFADTALTDIGAEFEEFAMDAGCTPRGIRPAHLADQRSDLGRNDGSSGLAAAHLPGPEQAKPGTMPSNDRFWLDDGERRAPATPEARQTDPQQAVSRGQFQAFCSRSPKHTDLVTQSQVLELEGGARSEDRRQSHEECHKSSEHRRNYERCNSHPFRSFEVFERHNSSWKPGGCCRTLSWLRIITNCASRSRRYNRWLCPV
jgi:hypothetical protein